MARKIKKTTTTTPRPMTLDERRNAAAAKAGAAVSIFTQAADDLEDAAEELYAVEYETAAEIARLDSLRSQVLDEANERFEQAGAIRALLTGNAQG